LLTIKLRELFVQIPFAPFQFTDLSPQVLGHMTGLDEQIQPSFYF
jgi:hypothetical protein